MTTTFNSSRKEIALWPGQVSELPGFVELAEAGQVCDIARLTICGVLVGTLTFDREALRRFPRLTRLPAMEVCDE